MFLPDSKKNLSVFILLLLICSSCRLFQSSNTNMPKPFTPEEIKSDIPFSNKEPEVFQAEIVITANGAESKKFIARNGAKQRFDYNVGAKNQVSVIQTDKIYTFLQAKKIYTETNFGKDFPIQDDFTSGLLNLKSEAEFTKIGTENNLTEYRINFPQNEKSEMQIFVDENLQIPVKQIFYSLENGEKLAVMTIEVKNFKLEAAEDLFILPNDYKKVSAEEFKKALQSENEK